MSESRILPVPEGLVGERVDAGLSRLLGLSRTTAAQIVDNGMVQLDGRLVQKSTKLTADSWLEVTLPESEAPKPVPVTDMEIIYDDEDLVVVNKPVGVAAHTGPGWDGPTVLGNLEAAGFTIATGGPPERKGIVSRLDVGTSGAMVVAKSELAYSRLKSAFREREVTKIYHAIVAGHPDPMRGTIDAPIGRHPSRTWRMAVRDDGKKAITHYDVEELFAGAALVTVHLETGRTHQIRVHMAAMGHPCVGDVFYGADPVQAEQLGLERQWLHARELGFDHPRTGGPMHVVAPYATDLDNALEILRG
ncbi:RluA family pseudouridine synthase [Scrofimicrobium canadense]|uniref:RluA family pseudouridine synthase n=1 Tax=Scrofimicrobium canadense TaxID=2652290 RepID=UPI0012B360EF|nr:RluA family pseudouridine synthase [Scrofimicrobium canadense]